MSLNNRSKKEVIVVLTFSLLLAGGASAQNVPSEAVEVETMSPALVTAGVSNLWNTQEIAVASLDAGVASVFSNIGMVAVEEHQAQMVAAAQSMEEEKVQDTSFCGYENLGIAIVEGNLNVREGASVDCDVVGKMTNHNACEIISETDGWYEITSGQVSGYVKSDYIVTGEEARAIAEEEVCTMAEVHTTTLRVRQEPSTDAEIVSMVGDGESLVVLEDLGDWIQVEVDDLTGYVFKEYVELSQKLSTAQTLKELQYGEGVSDVRVALVNFACEYVGNPYVWGGTSLTNGVDCSGFTMQVYAQYGISLPHSSKAQAGYGTRVDASEAQPGDLFFYGSGKSISHVAIYIGNGQIVHASNKRDGIKISSAFYRTPICVVRLLGDAE